MFGWVLRLGLLRFCTVIFLLIILPTCSNTEQSVYTFAILSICFVCLDRLASSMHIKQTKGYNFVLWYCSLTCLSLFRLSSEASALSAHNAEIMTFVNMKNMYTCLFDETYCFLKLIFYMVRYVCKRYGRIRPLFYAIYLHFNAILLLYVLNVLIARINLHLQNGMLRENNFFHEKISVSDILDGRPYVHENSSNTNVIDEILPNRQGVYREDYVRYLGEDIQIECDFHVRDGIALKELNFYWTRNSNRFDYTSDRIKEEVKLESSYDFIWVKMKLTIRFLEEDDFGLYKCVCETTRVFLVQHKPNIYMPAVYKTKYYIGKYLILRARETVETVEVPVGNIIFLKHFFYITEAPVDEISFEYRINGHDIHDICLPGLMSCTLSAILYALWRFGGPYKEKFLISEIKLAKMIVATLQTHMCVCGRFYGEHSLVMHIPYFNVTTGKEEIIEILHEKKITVQPISWWRNVSTPFENFLIQPDYENSRMKSYVAELICSNQEFEHLILNITSYLILVVMILVLFRFFSYAMKVYCKLTVMPVKNFIFYGHFLPRQVHHKMIAGVVDSLQIQYHVYISHSMDDYEWCKNILSYLEDDCGFKVCFPERDLVQEAGKTKLSMYSSATQACAKFLVILSQNYLDDPDCNYLQLAACILPLINESDGNGRNVIFIKRARGITIPLQLKWNTEIRTVDWTTKDSEDEKKIQLKRYLASY